MNSHQNSPKVGTHTCKVAQATDKMRLSRNLQIPEGMMALEMFYFQNIPEATCLFFSQLWSWVHLTPGSSRASWHQTLLWDHQEKPRLWHWKEGGARAVATGWLCSHGKFKCQQWHDWQCLLFPLCACVCVGVLSCVRLFVTHGL